MKIKLLCLITMYASIFYGNILDLPPSSKFTYPKELYPSSDIQKIIRKIFTDNFINLITNLDEGDALQKYLKDNFTILQYLPDDIKSIIVVQHESLPNFVFKFSRTPDIIIYNTKKKPGIKLSQNWHNLRLRVENSRKLQNVILQEKINSIKIPQKYLMYIQKFPIVIAEKINVPIKENLKNITPTQLQDLLLLVQKSNGILDLKPKNLILDKNNIYIIDTERVEQTSSEKLKNLITNDKGTKLFKESIDPKYIPCIDEWIQHLDNPKFKKITCLSIG